MNDDRPTGRLRIAAVVLVLALSATAPVAVAALRLASAPTLRVRPAAVHRGGRLVLDGRGFVHSSHVTLFARALHGTRQRIGSARTGLRGRFLAVVRIDAHARPGVYVASACQHRCRVRAIVRFRVLRH